MVFVRVGHHEGVERQLLRLEELGQPSAQSVVRRPASATATPCVYEPSTVIGKPYEDRLTLAYDKMFERFPNLRIASIENGSGFLGDLFVKLEQSKRRMPRYYEEDPAELFRRHVWINPFWEDKIPDVIEHMGCSVFIRASVRQPERRTLG